MARGSCVFYCLDTSEGAARSEDYARTTRFHFQKDLVACLSGSVLAGPSVRPPGSSTRSAAVLASSDGRPAVVLAPTCDTKAVQGALDALQPRGAAPRLAATIKTALLLARRFERARIIAFVGSPPQLSAGEVSDLCERLQQLQDEAEGPRVHVDLAVLCRQQELGESTVALLQQLGAAAAPQAQAAGAGSGGGGAFPRSSLATSTSAVAAGAPAAAAAAACASSPPASPKSKAASTVLDAAGASRNNGRQGPCRVIFVSPASGALDLWQQLEGATELLDGTSASPSASRRPYLPSNTDGGSSSGSDGGDGPNRTTDSGSNRRRLLRTPSGSSQQQQSGLHAPRVPLLAARSGVQLAASCRHDSLDWLGHLSSDGMLRSWLPNYSTVAFRSRERSGSSSGSFGAAMGALALGSAAGDASCFIQVQPIPRWRTLLSVAAGQMIASSPSASSSSAGGCRSTGNGRGGTSGSEAVPDAQAVQGRLAAMSLDGSGQPNSGESSGEPSTSAAEPSKRRTDDSGSASAAAGTSSRAAATAASTAAAPCAKPAAASFAPDQRRGRLRLLQALKDPQLLKLVWSAESNGSGGVAGVSGDNASSRKGADAVQQQPFNMFPEPPSPSSSSSSARGVAMRAAGSSTADPTLLGYLPASVAAASAARGPLLHEGCELWEAACSHDLELVLPLDGTALEAVQLPNGSQVVVFSVARGGSSSGGFGRVGSMGRIRGQQQQHVAFWLQQGWAGSCLQVPPKSSSSSTSGSVSGIGSAPDSPRHPPAAASTPASLPLSPSTAALVAAAAARARARAAASAAGASAAAATAPTVAGSATEGREESASADEERGAAALAAALRRLLAQPPPVDTAKLRSDVKDGRIPVTPITVGPLPLSFVRDICAARAEIMEQHNIENLDSFQGLGAPPSSSRGSSGGNGSSGSADATHPLRLPSNPASPAPSRRSGLTDASALASSSAGGAQPAATLAAGSSSIADGCTTASGSSSAGQAAGNASAAAAASAAEAKAIAVMQAHRGTVMSLLRQRLQQQQGVSIQAQQQQQQDLQGGQGQQQAEGSTSAQDPTSTHAYAGQPVTGTAAASADCVGSPGRAVAPSAAAEPLGGERAPAATSAPTPVPHSHAPAAEASEEAGSAPATPFGTPHLSILRGRPSFGRPGEDGEENTPAAPSPPQAAAGAAVAGPAAAAEPAKADAARDDSVLFDV